MSAPSGAAASPRRSRLRQGVERVSLLLGLGILVYLLAQVGLTTLLEHVRRLRWTYLVLLALYGGVNFFRTVSWRMCLGEDRRKLALRSALPVWLEGEAVAYWSFGWSGEAYRAAVLRDRLPISKNLSALIVSRIAYSYASLLVMAGSFLAAFFALPTLGRAGEVLVAIALLLMLLLLLPFTSGRLYLWVHQGVRARLAGAEPGSLRGRLRGFLQTFGGILLDFAVHNRRALLRLLAVNLLASGTGVFEIYFVLRALGADATLIQAYILEGGGKIFGLFAFIVPGNVGVREAGVAVLVSLFGLPAALGVTLSLVRRARAFGWAAIGSVVLSLRHGYRYLTEMPAPPPQEIATGEDVRPLS